PLPTSLGGTSVTVNGQPAPLYFVSPDQINFQMRMDQQGPVNVRVTDASGSADVNVNVAEAAPGIFSGAVQHADGTPVSAALPARVGETLVVYAAGLGPVDSQLEAGQVSTSSPLARAVAPITTEVGGISVVPDFAGLTPNFVGLYQVN